MKRSRSSRGKNKSWKSKRSKLDYKRRKLLRRGRFRP